MSDNVLAFLGKLLGFFFVFFICTMEAKLDVDLTHLSIVIPNDKKTINGDKAAIKRVNRTHPHLLVAEIEAFIELSDEYEGICFSHKKAGNEYKRLPYKIGPAKVCELINSEEIFYPELHQVTDFPPIGTCPWPKGVYHIQGYQPDTSKLPPVFGSGDYMVECNLRTVGNEDEVLQGIRIYATVINMGAL